MGKGFSSCSVSPAKQKNKGFLLISLFLRAIILVWAERRRKIFRKEADNMTKPKDRIYQLIGNTPLLRVKGLEQKFGAKAKIYAKLEYFNPAGSIKDRVAYQMIADAEEQGKLQKGSVIIEPTSGNTGIGLASIAAAKGYRAIFVMPDTMSVERRLLLAAYGAEIVLTPGAQGMKGAIEKADQLAASLPQAFIPAQFDNPSNPKAHMLTTGPEIWEQTEGAVDVLVAGIGTGGTVSGIGAYLKGKKPSVEVIGIEPASSPFLTQGKAGAHGIQGIGAGFKPAVLDEKILDRIIPVEDEAALSTGREIARTEGALVGISSGAAMWAALDLAKQDTYAGKNIVVILPDTGERYLSSKMFSQD